VFRLPLPGCKAVRLLLGGHGAYSRYELSRQPPYTEGSCENIKKNNSHRHWTRGGLPAWGVERLADS
jgi:hypothetical protein